LIVTTERWPQRLQLALASHEAGNLAQARAICEEILVEQPTQVDAINLLGAIAMQTGDPQGAAVLYGRALDIDPDNVAVWCNCALAFMHMGQFDAALERYDRAIALKADIADAEIYLHRGNVLGELKQYEAALASYQRATQIDSEYAEAYVSAGRALRELGLFEQALDSCERAISLVADYEEAYLIRGAALADLNRPDDALASFDQAIAFKPDYAEAYSNRGNVLAEMKRLDQALASFDTAIQLRPGFAEAGFNRALASLLRGDYENGCIDYEWRLKEDGGAFRYDRDRRRPQWRGREPLAGKRILLYAEQGLGDTLQFCRYAARVAQLGATVVLNVQRPLKELLATLQGVSQVVTPDDPLPDTDLQCPLLSLPLACGTRISSIPASNRYLAADVARVAQWRSILGPSSQMRVGLAWRSNPINRVLRKRDVALSDLIQSLPGGMQYFSLHNDLSEADRKVLQTNTGIRQFPDDMLGFADTAALCECLDLVLSVDTSLAHLSGALGKPTWILLPWVPDWRWLLEREDSPWYPTVRLYRQSRADDWHGALDRVHADLLRQSWSA
jgi:tetratricopeptide (TPR) repeat protein